MVAVRIARDPAPACASSPEILASPAAARAAVRLDWTRIDTVLMLSFLGAAAALRMWRLGRPPTPVFDEKLVLVEAGAYLRGWPYFVSPHPPLGKLLVTLGVLLFGSGPLGWRIPNAVIGSLLVALTYPLGRRMFRSRLAGAFAAMLATVEGLLLVASRTAMINIVYLALAAASYLALFRLRDAADLTERRNAILWAGIATGLCLGAKFAISVVALTLVALSAGAIIVGCGRLGTGGGPFEEPSAPIQLSSAAMLFMGAAGLCYLAVFLPYFWYGWWHGITDLARYNAWVVGSNLAITKAKPGASPFWSWPLLLRGFRYWDEVFAGGRVGVMWCGGNPVLWWTGLIAVVLVLRRVCCGADLAWAFAGLGWIAFMAMWLPVTRPIYVYDYAPALYLSLLALGGMLADCWGGNATPWEQIALLAPVFAALGFAVGPATALAGAGLVLAAYFVAMRWHSGIEAKVICIIVLGAAVANFAYFLPLWTATPLTNQAYEARMWFHGAGFANWK